MRGEAQCREALAADGAARSPRAPVQASARRPKARAAGGSSISTVSHYL